MFCAIHCIAHILLLIKYKIIKHEQSHSECNMNVEHLNARQGSTYNAQAKTVANRSGKRGARNRCGPIQPNKIQSNDHCKVFLCEPLNQLIPFLRLPP